MPNVDYFSDISFYVLSLPGDSPCVTVVKACISIPYLVRQGLSLSAAWREHHCAVLALLVNSDNSLMLAAKARTSEIVKVQDEIIT